MDRDQKYIYLIDNGHGGLIQHQYTTKGKRSPLWADNSIYYEGVGNRDIAKRLAQKLEDQGLNYHLITTGGVDTDLDDRVAVINAYCRMYGADKCILISIHSNGFSAASANGWEVWTTKGTTKSDPCATILYQETEKLFPERNFRSDKRDGDVDKEANFYIIANARCRAILSENFFHTNRDECQNILLKEEGRDLIADAHYNAILRMEKEL